MIARSHGLAKQFAKRCHGLTTLNARHAMLLWAAMSLIAILASSAVASPYWCSIYSNSAL